MPDENIELNCKKYSFSHNMSEDEVKGWNLINEVNEHIAKLAHAAAIRALESLDKEMMDGS